MLAGFVLIPFVLHLPRGKGKFGQYLGDIGLGRRQPFGRLFLLAISCALILAASQVLASLTYWSLEGHPTGADFLWDALDLAALRPFDSPDILVALPSALEEVGFRGVALTVFLTKYSERASIVFASIGFSLMHLLNLTSGRELEWVLGQLAWSFVLGLFYGYVFVRTRSLVRSKTVHFLGNATFNALSGHLLGEGSVGTQISYILIFAFGFVPATLMFLWTRLFTRRWLPGGTDYNGSSGAASPA